MTKRTCMEPGCDKVHDARGLCGAHYMQRKRLGTLPPPPAKPTPRERLAARSAPDGSCVLWAGPLNSAGYGTITVTHGGRRSHVGAHRLAYELAFGEIPEGLLVLHTCDVRRCVNPDHLFVGSQADNVADMMAKGRHWSQNPTPASKARPV